VGHAARLVFLRGFVQHAHSAPRIALLRAHDRANVVAKLLVFGEARRGPAEDPVGDVRLTAQKRQVRVIFRGAGRALPREAVAIGDLATLHPSSREAEAGVPPYRRAVCPQARFGFRELVDRLVDPAGGPVDEPRRVDGPRRLPGIADAGGMAHRRLGSGGCIDVVAGVREEMSELPLDARDDQVARAALWRGEEGVLSAPCALQRAGDLVLRRENGGVAEVQLGEHQRVASGMLLGDLRELRRLVAADEVIRELEKIDRDPRLEQRLLDQGKDFIELGPREIERLEVLEASCAKDSPLERLTSARELRKETFGVGTRERRKRLVSQGRHTCITP